MTCDELKTKLWGAAQILRGSIDAGGYKEYVFPLVFFKRICDVHREEYRKALAASGDEEFARLPENYTFAIPEGCDWEDVRTVTANVGQALTTAFLKICEDLRVSAVGAGEAGNEPQIAADRGKNLTRRCGEAEKIFTQSRAELGRRRDLKTSLLLGLVKC